MSKQHLLLDPALFAWEIRDYQSRKTDYWQLAEDLMELIDILDSAPFAIIMGPGLASELVDAFPACDIAGSFHDLNAAVFSFLARQLCGDVGSSESEVQIVPDIGARPHFTGAIATELKKCLGDVHRNWDTTCAASHTTVWEFAHPAQLVCSATTNQMSVAVTRTSYSLLRGLFKREFERGDKHDPKYGWGTRLPVELTDNMIEAALSVAIELKGPKLLAARCGEEGVVLLFRRHEKNTYHAYPIEPKDYSKYAVQPDKLPWA